MGKFDPGVGFMDKILGRPTYLIALGLIIGYGYADIFGHVQAHAALQFTDYGLHGTAGIKDIINDEQPVGVLHVLHQVIKAENLDFTGLIVDTGIGRGTDGDMIGMDAVKRQKFLHRNPYGRPAPPDGDDKGGFEAAAQNLVGQFKGVFQQPLGCQVKFLHYYPCKDQKKKISFIQEKVEKWYRKTNILPL